MRVALVNRSKEDLGFNLVDLADALNGYNELLVDAWGSPVQATVHVRQHFPPDMWALVFLTLSDDPEALAYHDLTPHGTPLAKVFVDTNRAAGADLAMSASHEFAEMLVDPDINKLAHWTTKGFAAVEVCDPCEESDFDVGGFRMSDFVYPAYFQNWRRPGSAAFDWMSLIDRPFEVLPGGYQQVFVNGHWTNVFGSEDKAARFAQEDRRGHRSESRKTE